MVADELDAVSSQQRPQQPLHEAEARQEGDEDEPEPEERVDLLRVHIDGQHALHAVTMNVPQAPHLELVRKALLAHSLGDCGVQFS